MSDAIKQAKQVAWRAALTLARGDRATASLVQDRAELAVIRHLVSEQLQNGEVGYWQLVEEEIKR